MADMACLSEAGSSSLTFTSTIPFALDVLNKARPGSSDDYIQSPGYHMAEGCPVRFRTTLCPRGLSIADQEFISMYLCADPASFPPFKAYSVDFALRLETRMRVIIKELVYKNIKFSSEGRCSYGNSEFIHRESIMDRLRKKSVAKQQLVVTCELHVRLEYELSVSRCLPGPVPSSDVISSTKFRNDPAAGSSDLFFLSPHCALVRWKINRPGQLTTSDILSSSQFSPDGNNLFHLQISLEEPEKPEKRDPQSLHCSIAVHLIHDSRTVPAGVCEINFECQVKVCAVGSSGYHLRELKIEDSIVPGQTGETMFGDDAFIGLDYLLRRLDGSNLLLLCRLTVWCTFARVPTAPGAFSLGALFELVSGDAEGSVMVLCALLQTFSAEFGRLLSEGTRQLRLPASLTTLKKLHHFLTSGMTQMTLREALELRPLAARYELWELHYACNTYLAEHISAKTVARVNAVADGHLGVTLRTLCQVAITTLRTRE